MRSNVFEGLELVNASGWVILTSITLVLVLGIFATLVVARRYDALERDVRRHAGLDDAFEHPMLVQIVRDAKTAQERGGDDVNTQAILEQRFHEHLGGLLLAERFLKSASGLVIILGLAGAFYGNTMAIGRLVGLVSGDAAAVADLTQTLTHGLTQALAGMSVAFSTSLFGVGAAVVLTVVGVFFNLVDRRTRLMVRLETYVDNVLLRGGGGASSQRSEAASMAASADIAKLARIMDTFGQSVGRLESSVKAFDTALHTFSTNTRDFQEFNAHLKDNVQRMSLSFGDMSEVVKSHVALLAERDRRK